MAPMRRRLWSVLFACGCTSALAQEGLYDPAPPPGSAFVRLANGTAAPLTGGLGAKTTSAPKAGVSPYLVAPQGNLTVKVGGVSQQLKVAAGQFYTVLWSGKALKALTDQTADNRAKALLTVYNLGPAPADLKTADGRTAVIAATAPGRSASRAVNGVRADLAVFRGGKALSTFKGVQLARGAAYAVVVTPAGATLSASTTQTK